VPRLSILAVSARLPAWAEAACADYARRMPKGYEVARTSVRNEKALKVAVPRQSRLVALDERGKDLDTRQFAALLERETAFVIGGPEGLSDEVKREAALLMRVSSFTVPHALAQVILVEQIYRAATLLTGHPYHRG
jgi:23S rRNA (pseudouridine1915-N3)-methyltransferase